MHTTPCTYVWERAHRDGMEREMRLWMSSPMTHPCHVSLRPCVCGCMCFQMGQAQADGVTCWPGFRYVKVFSSFTASPCRKPSEYIAAILELSGLVAKRHQQLLLHMDFLYRLTCDGQRFRKACRLVHDFTDAVIQERRRTLPKQGIDDFLKAKAQTKTLDFIDVLLLSKVGVSTGRIIIWVFVHTNYIYLVNSYICYGFYIYYIYPHTLTHNLAHF